MNSPAAKLPLSPEHQERITAIREKAQRHIQHSARLFSPVPEETDNSLLLPVPSLLAVACTAALANQAQAAPMANEEDINGHFKYWGGNIELTNDITLSNNLEEIPVTFGSSIATSINIDGQNHYIDGNGYSIFRPKGSYRTTLKNVENIELRNGVSKDDGRAIYIINAGNIANSIFTNNQAQAGQGGALALYEYGYGAFNKSSDTGSIDSIISNSTFTNNVAKSGVAIATFEVGGGFGG